MRCVRKRSSSPPNSPSSNTTGPTAWCTTSPTWAAIRCITSSWTAARWCRRSSPTPSAACPGRPGMTRCMSAGMTTVAWCCSHESLSASPQRQGTGDQRPLSVDVPVLPAALRHRTEDQLLPGGDRDPALRAPVPVRRPGADHCPEHGQLHLPHPGQPVLRGLPVLIEDRPVHHPGLPAARLPDGAGHCPRAPGAPVVLSAADYVADLGGVRDSSLCVDGHAEQ